MSVSISRLNPIAIIMFISIPMMRALPAFSKRNIGKVPSIDFESVQFFVEGDWAGHSVNLSEKTGRVVPVPDHVVPESLLEWGQGPDVSLLNQMSSVHIPF